MKYTDEELIEKIKDFLHLYLFKGDVSENQYWSHRDGVFDLTEDDLDTLKTVHFFLSDEVRDLIRILPKLSRNLSHSTKKDLKINHGIIRGRIDWPQTIKERYSQGYNDPSLFVCQPPSKYYDLEENQLLKFLLNKLISLKRKNLKFVSEFNFNYDDLDSSDDWYKIVNDNYQMCIKTLKKVYFSNIKLINSVKPKHVRLAYKNRNPLYHKVAEVFSLYSDLFLDDNCLEKLEELLTNRIIKASNSHKLYEIFVFFSLINALPNKKQLKLLHSGNLYHVGCVLNEDENIVLYYQKTPEQLKDYSKYLKIMENYDIKAKIRLPDVIIEFNKENNTYYRFVEVKDPDNGNDYIRDSVYKVMGYYKDFEDMGMSGNLDFVKEYPVVLVVSEEVKFKKNDYGEVFDPFNDDYQTIIKKEYEPFIKQIIILDTDKFEENINKLIINNLN